VVLAFVLILGAGALVGSALSQWGRPDILPLPEGVLPRVSERVRVEVLNGGGAPGMAREATDRLREVGFDVVFFGNASSFEVDSSVVLDRADAVDKARSVADVLGIRHVRSEPDPNLYLDVSVLLGRDWRPPRQDEEAVQGSRHRWWDPRRWIGQGSARDPERTIEVP